MFFLVPFRLTLASLWPRIPAANAVLVAINVLAWCFDRRFVWSVGPGTGPLSILTYGIAHANSEHLIANMWALLVFGNPVNRRLGNAWYATVYLGVILAIGIFARLIVRDYLLGASGAVFAIIIVASILLPRAKLELLYIVLFPMSLIVGLFSRPKEWLFWLIRWGKFEIGMLWCLLLVPGLELWSLFWGGWNWTNIAHLLGVACGIVTVLVLPVRITMPGRAAAAIS